MTKPRRHEPAPSAPDVVHISMLAELLPALRVWAHTRGLMVAAIPGDAPDQFIIAPGRDSAVHVTDPSVDR